MARRNGLVRYSTARTHITTLTAESLEKYLSSELRERIPDLASYQGPFQTGWAGGESSNRHIATSTVSSGVPVGAAGRTEFWGRPGPREGAEREFQHFMGQVFPTLGSSDYDPDARIRDMDREGVDAHMMVPAGLVGHEDPWVEMEFIRANHRYLNDFCSEYPRRWSLIVVTPHSIEASVDEIKRWGGSSWAVGVQPHLPLDYPLDHPGYGPRSGPPQTRRVSASCTRRSLPGATLGIEICGTTHFWGVWARIHGRQCGLSPPFSRRAESWIAIPTFRFGIPGVRLRMAALLGPPHGRPGGVHGSRGR